MRVSFFAVVLLAAGFIHLFVRHESMKLELKIMLNMGILLIGLLVNASAADSTVVYATVSNVEWGALAHYRRYGLLLPAGLLLSKINFKKLINRHN